MPTDLEAAQGKVAFEAVGLADTAPENVETLQKLAGVVPSTPTITSVDDAFQKLADAGENELPRAAKLHFLKTRATTPQLKERVSDNTAKALAAAVVDPNGALDDDARDSQVDQLLAATDAYADDVALEEPEKAADANPADQLRPRFQRSAALFDATKKIVSDDDLGPPPPEVIEYADGDARCFHVYLEVADGTVDEFEFFVNPLDWTRCGSGFWKQVVQDRDRASLYYEQVTLMPEWTVWVLLATERRDATDASEKCLDYRLAIAADLEIDEGFICVRALGGGGVAIEMKKCLRFENDALQALLPGLSAWIAPAVVQMAETCRGNTVARGA